MSQAASVAVLGGGISGLATAYYLAKSLPRNAHITLYESSKRLGGWIESTRVALPSGTHELLRRAPLQAQALTKVPAEDEVLFEHGPRTLRVSKRVSSVNMFDMIRRLGLEEDLIVVRKDSAAARNRYIYWAGRINKVPYSVTSILRFYFSQPLFRGMLGEVLREPFRATRSGAAQDESIGSFMSRRFGKRITDRLVAAALHGIYAGDIYQLSVRSILEYLWRREKNNGSIISLWPKGKKKKEQQKLEKEKQDAKRPSIARNQKYLTQLQLDNEGLLSRLEGASIVSFKSGMQVVVDRMAEELAAAENVTVKQGALVTKLERASSTSDDIAITTADGERATYSHVISTVPAWRLADMTDGSAPDFSRLLRQIPSVSVGVVNLFFSETRLLPVTGFGYLLPRGLPPTANPEHALGVVFDSDAVAAPDGTHSLQDTAQGTKITVMLGGHWWSGPEGAARKVHDSADAIAQSRQLLARQLGVSASPALAQARVQERCIPQYVVGHTATLRALDRASVDAFGNRLMLAGASFRGVSVNDCVYNARLAAEAVAAGTARGGVAGFEEEEE
ncbi:uncharacterized protein V1518DRAFT_421410 [Limtongia smithiae]|uniref:uncharacterized protein n=1 Tax=Limtongia smithiae TaxID=1125753 RepID=UPI0034CF9C5D